MRKWTALAGAVVMATAMSAGSASAQISLSLGGGPSFPLGDFADGAELGYNAQASAAFSIPMFPIGVRVDGMFNSFKADEAVGEEGSFRIISGTANAVLNLPLPFLTPYVIGGVGMYKSEFNHDGEDDGHEHEASTDFGFNAGLGARLSLPGLGVFAELRMHNISGDGASTRFAPLTLGVRF